MGSKPVCGPRDDTLGLSDYFRIADNSGGDAVLVNTSAFIRRNHEW
jgi:hypothetical protein